MALVGLVTPADAASPSVTAFQNEGDRLGWGGSINVYSLANAQTAHDDVQHAGGGVLVAAGEMAATAVQTASPSTEINPLPIIVAYAGAVPGNADKNMAGFIGDCTTLARNHLKLLKQNYAGPEITVLYDQDPNNEVTKNILKAVRKDDNTINAKGIAIANIKGQIAALLTTPGFMMIPNAVFFEHAGEITDAVDKSAVQLAYYPEFEYWSAHKNKNKPKVSGYNVPLTYRLAASWVDHLLTGYWDLNYIEAMPKKFAQAIPDPYEDWISLRSRRRRG